MTGTASRQQRGTATRRALGVLAVFWLNLVAAPCSMAFDGGHSCTHCPPAQQDAGASHHGHHGESARSDCATLSSDCDERAAASIDARQAQAKLKSKPELVAIAAAPWHEPEPVAARLAMVTVVPPDPVTAPPPTYLLNCVFRK
jgi:hypothetical protein